MNKSTYETRTQEDGNLFMQWRQWLMKELSSSAQPRTLPDVSYGEHTQSDSSKSNQWYLLILRNKTE